MFQERIKQNTILEGPYFWVGVLADMFCNCLCVLGPIQLRRICAVDLKVKVGKVGGTDMPKCSFCAMHSVHPRPPT